MNWDNIKYFIATARAGSLSVAASKLSSSPATLSRRLISLEADCGTTLFNRTHAGYALTADGEALLEECLKIESAFAKLELALPRTTTSPAGVVRVAASENLINLVLLPALAGLSAAYPLIRIEFFSSVQLVPLHAREADIAVRLSTPMSGKFKVRTIGRLAHALYASRSAALNHIVEDMHIIGWPEGEQDLPIAVAASEHRLWREPRLRMNTLQGHIAAARGGLGLAYLPCFVGDACDDLVRVDGPGGFLLQELYLLVHNDTVESRRTRIVADFIADTVRAARGTLQGEVPSGDPAAGCTPDTGR